MARAITDEEKSHAQRIAVQGARGHESSRAVRSGTSGRPVPGGLLGDGQRADVCGTDENGRRRKQHGQRGGRSGEAV